LRFYNLTGLFTEGSDSESGRLRLPVRNVPLNKFS
jgi:hypothetical protein